MIEEGGGEKEGMRKWATWNSELHHHPRYRDETVADRVDGYPFNPASVVLNLGNIS